MIPGPWNADPAGSVDRTQEGYLGRVNAPERRRVPATSAIFRQSGASSCDQRRLEFCPGDAACIGLDVVWSVPPAGGPISVGHTAFTDAAEERDAAARANLRLAVHAYVPRSDPSVAPI